MCVILYWYWLKYGVKTLDQSCRVISELPNTWLKRTINPLQSIAVFLPSENIGKPEVFSCFQELYRQGTFAWQKQPLGVFHKKDVLKNFAKFTGEHLCRNLFFNKIAGLRHVILIKEENSTQMFSCEFWEIFTEHLRATASDLKWDNLNYNRKM